jgi:hypothetical protein
MPCDTIRSYERQTLAERMEEVAVSLKQLETALSKASVKVVIGANGAVTLTGWKPEDRRGLTDVCAIRSLTASNSSALRMAVAKAEAMSGRKVNMQAVASGVHSHDGGRTWDKH